MTLIYLEDFETDGNGTRYFTNVAEFTDGGGDFYTRTDTTNIAGSYAVTGFNGNFFFAGMDQDGEGGPAVTVLTLAAIDITGYANLQFSGLFAEDDDGTNQDWDDADFALIEYQIDGGGWTNLLAFEAAELRDDGSSNTFNKQPQQDTNFDGFGDGAALTSVFTEFTADIAGTGASLEIRLTLSLDSGDEDFAFDDLSVNGDVAFALNEQFDDASSFDGEVNFFSDTEFDYFGIHDPNGINTDFGGDTAPNAAFLSRYTGFDGSFVVLQDIDGEGGPNEVSLDWTGIDISSLTNIEFTGLFAEAFASDGADDWDAADEVRIEAQIDGAAMSRFWLSPRKQAIILIQLRRKIPILTVLAMVHC